MQQHKFTPQQEQHKDTPFPSEQHGEAAKIFTIAEGEDMNAWTPSAEQVAAEPSDDKQWIRDALREAYIDPDSEPPELPVFFTIGDATLATLGNFSCITGKAKSKKTFLITLLAGHCMKALSDNDKFKVTKFSNKRRIVWFDTEQGLHRAHRAQKRAKIFSEGGKVHDPFSFDLRKYLPRERYEIIDHYINSDECNKDNDIAFVVIDGIRDLITDINDPEQATTITTWLMRVSQERGLHICTVLHQNKADNNARGHLGTEIINKAETVFSVEKDQGAPDISIVRPEQCREKEFDPFAFSIGQGGVPYILENHEIKVPGERAKKFDPSDISDYEHQQIFNEIFSIQKEYTPKDLVGQIKLLYFKHKKLHLSGNKVETLLLHVRNQKIITHNQGNTKNARYLLTVNLR